MLQRQTSFKKMNIRVERYLRSRFFLCRNSFLFFSCVSFVPISLHLSLRSFIHFFPGARHARFSNASEDRLSPCGFFRCNIGSFAAAATTKTMKVRAGDNVGFKINSVLGHNGPLFAYMSKTTVPDVSAYEGDGDWFKVYEMGAHTHANYQVAMTWITYGWT